MLETAFKTEYVPGTNLNGDLACASWRFLLPSLRFDNILCLGIPPAATLTILPMMSKDVTIISDHPRNLAAVNAEIERQGLSSNIQTARIADFTRLPFQNKSVALVLMCNREELAGMRQDPTFFFELCRLLRNDGVIYFESHTWSDLFADRRMLKKVADFGLGSPRIYWVTPFHGELRTAFPLGDGKMSGYLFTNVLYGQSFHKRAISYAGALLSRTRLLHYVTRRRSVLIRRQVFNAESQQLPPYLVSLARKDGVDLSDMHCGLSARGKYNANKTIFYLFNRGSDKANMVVKITRAPEFNYRLENEYRVLSLLREKSFVDRSTFPDPLFFGYHANLAILGQRAVRGVPFRSRTKAIADCPIAREAINWIVKLGVSSVNRTAATADQAGGVLIRLFRRFAEIYNLSRSENDFLKAQIKKFSQVAGQFPLVFQHGDPGTWNIFVSEPGGVIVMDWEAGEPQGMPLWDLFYFMRSFGNWISRMEGHRDSLQNFARQFLESSELSALLASTVAQYCILIGLDENLIEPLFYTCWMHRALKESTRLTEAVLQNGHYVNLLRLCIKQRQAPALNSLFSLSQHRQSRTSKSTSSPIAYAESL